MILVAHISSRNKTHKTKESMSKEETTHEENTHKNMSRLSFLCKKTCCQPEDAEVAKILECWGTTGIIALCLLLFAAVSFGLGVAWSVATGQWNTRGEGCNKYNYGVCFLVGSVEICVLVVAGLLLVTCGYGIRKIGRLCWNVNKDYNTQQKGFVQAA
jgi:hypothetical protein